MFEFLLQHQDCISKIITGIQKYVKTHLRKSTQHSTKYTQLNLHHLTLVIGNMDKLVIVFRLTAAHLPEEISKTQVAGAFTCSRCLFWITSHSWLMCFSRCLVLFGLLISYTESVNSSQNYRNWQNNIISHMCDTLPWFQQLSSNPRLLY